MGNFSNLMPNNLGFEAWEGLKKEGNVNSLQDFISKLFKWENCLSFEHA